MKSLLLPAVLAACTAFGAGVAAQEHGLQSVLGEVFSSSPQPYERFGSDLCVVDDLGGDGIPEFLVGNQQNEVFLVDGRSGSGITSFVTQGSQPRSFLCEDYDGDGLREWAIVDDWNGAAPEIQLWSAAGFSGFNVITLPSTESFVIAAEPESDRDGDGFRELFVVSTTNGVQAVRVRYVSPIDGSVVREFLYTPPMHPWYVSAAVLGDVDLDGVLDFVIGNINENMSGIQQAGSVRVYSGATGAPLYETFGTDYLDRLGIRVARAPDLDGDGIDDLVALSVDADYFVACSPARGVVLYRQDTGAIAAGRYRWPLAWAEDRDGDGRRDFFEGAFLRSGLDGRVLRELQPASMPVLPFGYGRAHALTVDFDGDGLRELLCGANSHTPPHGEAVLLQSVRAGIRSTAQVLHAQSPQPITFHLDFPDAVHGHHYQLLASTAPIGSTTVVGLGLPLGDSPLLYHMLQRPPSGTLPGGAGIVPASGSATAVLAVGAPLALQALGMTIRFAVATGQSGSGTWSSFSIPVTVLP